MSLNDDDTDGIITSSTSCFNVNLSPSTVQSDETGPNITSELLEIHPALISDSSNVHSAGISDSSSMHSVVNSDSLENHQNLFSDSLENRQNLISDSLENRQNLITDSLENHPGLLSGLVQNRSVIISGSSQNPAVEYNNEMFSSNIDIWDASLSSSFRTNPHILIPPGSDYRGIGVQAQENVGERNAMYGRVAEEVENGYPLVADLRQLRLERQDRALIESIIHEENMNEEILGELVQAEVHPTTMQLTGEEYLEHIDFRMHEIPRNNESLRNRILMECEADSTCRESSNEDVVAAAVPVDCGEVANEEVTQMSTEQLDQHLRSTVNITDKGVQRKLKYQLNTFDSQNVETVSPSNRSNGGWQATKNSLKERFSHLYRNEILSDVVFIIGSGAEVQKIPAHKFILITGSAVFDAMFNGELANGGKDICACKKQEEIELPDVEPAAFLALLKFLYTDELPIEPETVMTILYTAKKYAVPAIENSCVEFLKNSLGADNAFMLLAQAQLFDEPQLASLCLDVIDKNTLEALNAEGFMEIDVNTLCTALSRDTLRVREASLFVAVLKWSIAECHRRSLCATPENQRFVLGKALYMIRFPLMSIDEFAQYAAQAGVLTDREIVNLFLYFTVNPKPQCDFSNVPRCCVFGKEVVVSRFQRIEARWGYSGTADRIKFTVDRQIYVIGFGLYGSVSGPTECQVTIQILHCGTGKVLASNDVSFIVDGSRETFRILFKEPVEITPSVTYIASACITGPDSHYGTKGLRRIVHQSPSTGVVTFQFTYAAGNNNGTSVEDGQIPEIIFCTKII